MVSLVSLVRGYVGGLDKVFAVEQLCLVPASDAAALPPCPSVSLSISCGIKLLKVSLFLSLSLSLSTTPNHRCVGRDEFVRLYRLLRAGEFSGLAEAVVAEGSTGATATEFFKNLRGLDVKVKEASRGAREKEKENERETERVGGWSRIRSAHGDAAFFFFFFPPRRRAPGLPTNNHRTNPPKHAPN